MIPKYTEKFTHQLDHRCVVGWFLACNHHFAVVELRERNCCTIRQQPGFQISVKPPTATEKKNQNVSFMSVALFCVTTEKKRTTPVYSKFQIKSVRFFFFFYGNSNEKEEKYNPIVFHTTEAGNPTFLVIHRKRKFPDTGTKNLTLASCVSYQRRRSSPIFLVSSRGWQNQTNFIPLGNREGVKKNKRAT